MPHRAVNATAKTAQDDLLSRRNRIESGGVKAKAKSKILIGTASWSDPGFVEHWYPKKMPAGDRLTWYAQHFQRPAKFLDHRAFDLRSELHPSFCIGLRLLLQRGRQQFQIRRMP